jgi:cytochrome P450
VRRGKDPPPSPDLRFDPVALIPGDAGPYAAYARLRSEAPLYRSPDGGFSALSRFEDVRAASRDWDAFSNADGVDLDGLGPQIFGPGDFLDVDPPEHDELRGLVKSRFTPKAVAGLAPLVRALSDDLLSRLVAMRTADAVEHLAWALPFRVMCSIVGFGAGDQERLNRLYRTVVRRSPGTMRIPSAALEAGAEMRSYFVSEARDRRERPRHDLMTQVAIAEIRGERLDERKLAGVCFVLFSAGIDTVAGLLGSALLLFAENPDQRRLLSHDASKVAGAIEEVLRYESPLQFNARTTTRQVTVGNGVIPAGERVLLLYGSANRDERRFDTPHRFDVTREPKRHLGFGEGIHFCIGAPLARLQARIVLEGVLSRMPEYEVAGKVERLAAYNMRSLARLPISV